MGKEFSLIEDKDLGNDGLRQAASRTRRAVNPLAKKIPANIPPLLPKPKDGFWATLNRYYDLNETVRFKCMRGDKYAEGEGVIVGFEKCRQYGRVNYIIKPTNRESLVSKEERTKGTVNAMLEDIEGGPWNSVDKGKQHENKGKAAPPCKRYSFVVQYDEQGKFTLSQSESGFASDFELMGWLRYLQRAKEVWWITHMKPVEEGQD